ncbi:MAG TPA: hypothetical protein VFG38_04665 [Pseudomonadales bacterium]|nr:hypothetical protein [Pseudomonadales bacterium]
MGVSSTALESNPAIAGYALAAAVGVASALARTLMGDASAASVSAGIVAAVAVLPLLRWCAGSDSVHAVAWMTLAGLIGWLIGVRMESGPFGLVIVESWCSSNAATGIGGAIAKLEVFPLSHLCMIVSAMVGMTLAMRARRERRVLRCCAINLLLMPAAMVVADAGVLAAADRLGVRVAVQMLGAMSATMIVTGLLGRMLVPEGAARSR